MTNRFAKSIGILAAGALALGLTACGGGGATKDPGSDAAQDPNEAAAAGTLQLSEWEESSGIFNTDETDEELYEKAKEEGKVTIYSISSRITKVANAFMEKYPGIEVEPFDISTNELLEKVTREYDAGQHVADVVHIKDQDGTLYNEYILPRKFYNYKPADILSHIDEKYTKTQTPMYVELTQLFYNSEAYPDGSPVTNIWQLTEPQWKGKIMMQNPLDNLSWGSWITGFCVGEEPNRLAEAYKTLYGEELKLSDGCENAGYEFLKRLHANEPIFTASSDAIAEAVGRVDALRTRAAIDHWKAAGLDLSPILLALMGCKDDAAYGAALFHATLAAGLAEWTVLAGQVPAGGQVAVAGGCAMNAILMAQLRSHLERDGISLLEARQVPPNDGGLALGQAWLARQAASTR